MIKIKQKIEITIVSIFGLILLFNPVESDGALGGSTAYGSLNISQDRISVSDELVIIEIFGIVENYNKGQEIFFEIIDVNSATIEMKTRANNDGVYNTSVFVDANWQKGEYEIIGKYKDFEIGSASFQITSLMLPPIRNFEGLGTMEIEEEDRIISGEGQKFVDIVGHLENYERGEPILLKILMPEDMIEEVIIKGKKNGDFVAHISIKEHWAPGNYKIMGSYQEKKFGEVSFEIKKIQIPQWIKNNALWWSEELIADDDFIQGIQFLINNGIMKIPETIKAENSDSKEIPPWIKNNAKWWGEDLISDDDFVKGIQYLVEVGMIRV